MIALRRVRNISAVVSGVFLASAMCASSVWANPHPTPTSAHPSATLHASPKPHASQSPSHAPNSTVTGSKGGLEGLGHVQSKSPTHAPTHAPTSSQTGGGGNGGNGGNGGSAHSPSPTVAGGNGGIGGKAPTGGANH